MPSDTINLVHDDGTAITVPVDQAAALLASKRFRVEQGADVASRTVEGAREEMYGGVGGAVRAGVAGVARGATFGLSDVAARTLGGEDLARDLRGVREENQGISMAGEVVGSLVPGGAGSLAAKAGRRVAGTGSGGLAQVARAGAAGATEGALMGAGAGVSELALSDDPLTLERMASAIGSNALFGAATGGALGAGGKVVEKGLMRAKAALDEGAKAGVGRLGVADDLATLDRKGLKLAEKAEHDAIEAARIPKRAEVADEIKSFRAELKESKLWLATKGAEDAEIRALGKRTLKADRALDNILDDPKALAESPKAALKQLRVQEAALDDMVNKHGPKLRESFAADTSGTRAAALDYASTALEKNRALQSKIGELTSAPASQRLSQISDAVEALSAPKPAPGLAQDLLGGSVFGHVAGAFSGLPIVGPMIGAKAAKLVSGLVGGKMGAASAEVAARGSKAVQTFLDVGRKVAPAAPVLATKVLSAVAYAPSRERRADTVKAHTLASAFKARSEEIRGHVEPGPDGALQMRRASREQLAGKLAPIAAANPLLADRIESTKAKAVEFLASKLPRRPDVGGIPVGPDKWQPSDMEMRTWARYVAAVEDPNGVVERLASGAITPEDVEAITQVYPEMHADITRQIVEQLPTLRAQLPYQRRLALSMFSKVPVDPALDPRVLRILQGSFANEEGTEQGTQAPRPQPQFGSVTKPEPTPAQQRGG
jgi:hypothetical protein